MNTTDLDPETQARYALTGELRNTLVTMINEFLLNRQQPRGVSTYQIGLMALVSALADFIAVAPEEKQAGIFKEALAMLEHAYVVNLTNGNL